MSGHDDAGIKDAFAGQDEVMRKIYTEGMDKYVKGLQGLDKAFAPADLNVRCIDEGTPGGLHLAGSGILLGVEKAGEVLKAAGVTGITSHDGCGAAGIYARNNNLDASKSDEYGKEFAKELAEKTGIPYTGHIPFGEMKRPAAFHTARAAYYDGTGKFNCDTVPGLPIGFVVSRKFIDPAYALEEAKVCANIATGDHSYGEMITEEAPFLLIAVGDGSDGELGKDALMKELEPLAAAFGGKVKIDGFVMPV